MTKYLPILLASLFIASFSFAQDKFLADKHMAKNVNCQACHLTQAPKPGVEVSSSTCIKCHGTLEQLGKKSKSDSGMPDPHYNHLVNTNCNECHRGHTPSQNVCSNCHNLNYQVP